MNKSFKLVSSFLGLLLLSACSFFGEPANVEIASYKVIKKQDNIEIREYEGLVMASTVVDGSFDDMANPAFRRLFKYISGANKGQAPIAMTSPVFMEEGGKKIAMTSPVIGQKTGSQSWKMSFVLPSTYTKATAPKPEDSLIKIESLPKRQVAAITFAWWMNEENIEKYKTQLSGWLRQNKYSFDVNRYEVAGYNPPWTLPPVRRNEVIIPLSKQQSGE